MKRMKPMKRICLMLLCAAATAWAAEGTLTTTKDGTLRWEPSVARAVRILAPELTGQKAILKNQSIEGNEAVLP